MFRIFPLNILSYVIGLLVRIQHPALLARWVVKIFARAYNISLDEATQPLESYTCLGKFFTRDLRPEARPLGDGVLSPVDGILRSAGTIEGVRLMQIKGRYYSVSDLLGDEALAARFADGWYANLYLSPRHYHHVHSPVSGFVAETTYIPGSLWPVNDWSLRNVPNLFGRNERTVSLVQSDSGLCAVVMVGATNVGCIELTYEHELPRRYYPSFMRATSKIYKKRHDPPAALAKGSRLGTFRMGSSVVVLLEKRAVTQAVLPDPARGGEIRFGETIFR